MSLGICPARPGVLSWFGIHLQNTPCFGIRFIKHSSQQWCKLVSAAFAKNPSSVVNGVDAEIGTDDVQHLL
jgi:hypothetical protein